MKFMIESKFMSNIRNLGYRMWSFRFVTFVIMIIFFMDMYLNPFRMNVRILGQNCNIAVLPFLQTSDYYMKIAFLGVVYFYSNVPFMEKEELFYLSRLGKRGWGWRNICYLIESSLILTICFLMTSLLEVMSIGKISLSWDSVYKTLSLTGGQNLQFSISYFIMKEYTPLFLMTLILFMDWMVILFIAMLMYVIGLYGYRILSCVIAILIVFLPSIDAWVGGILIYYSPLSWLDCSNWRIGYDNRKPDLPYMIVAIIFLNMLLLLFGQHYVKKMEWKTSDD